MSQVIVSGSFDDMRSRHIRLLQEAARLGELHVLLWSDEMVRARAGVHPKFPQQERQYFVESVRYVDRVSLINVLTGVGIPRETTSQDSVWAVHQDDSNEDQKAFCQDHGLHYSIISQEQLQGFPEPDASNSAEEPLSERKKVLVTGCFDWFHSGHVRFFEEVSELGDVYVVLGHDANIALLKGEGHPMVCEDERRYIAGSIRFVKRALISSGNGWLDAEPEIEQIKPDIYAVNEDGDVAEKRDYCQAHGIEYHVLKRAPKTGLPKRQSTDLRGF